MKRALLAALVLLGACSTEVPSGPQPGPLNVMLTAGGATDGAIVLVVSGGPVTSVDAPAGYEVASNADGQGTHIMVIGNLAVGAIATITVPDPAKFAAYTVTVSQVSDRNTFVLLDPARYQAVVSR